MSIQVGDTVRIARDRHARLVGLLVQVVELGEDGTTALVRTQHAAFWCSVSNLEHASPAADAETS